MTTNPLTREYILENYRDPQNVGKPDDYNHSHKLSNRTCGDEIEVFVKVDTEGKVQQLNYEISACAISVATSSILSEELQGKTIEEIRELEQDFVEGLLETKLSISRVKCAMLPLRAIQQALGVRESADAF